MSQDYHQMMQERLDGQLDAEREEELFQHLERDMQAAEENAQLESVHGLLSDPPVERAPQRLAITIMARLAQHLEAQAELQQLPEEIQQALMLSWSLVSVSMMPVMVAASSMVLNAQASPAMLNRVLNQSISLMVLMIDALVVMLEEVERLIEEDPDMAPVALSLIPTALLGMLDYVEDKAEGEGLDLL